MSTGGKVELCPLNVHQGTKLKVGCDQLNKFIVSPNILTIEYLSCPYHRKAIIQFLYFKNNEECYLNQSFVFINCFISLIKTVVGNIRIFGQIS